MSFKSIIFFDFLEIISSLSNEISLLPLSGKALAEKIKKKIGIDIAPEPKQVIENIASDDKIKKETSTDEKKTEVSKVKKQTSDKKLEAENKPKK